MTRSRRTLIVAKPGPLREGLLGALSAMPCVVVVGEADEPASALKIELDPAPALIVLSADNSGYGALEAWQQLKARWPEARCIILAETVQQQERARAGGANPVLLKGFAASRLFAAVETLFSDAEKGDPVWDLLKAEE